MLIKVCGMREPENIAEAAALGPDYLGFVFYRPSPRFAGNSLNAVQLQHLDPAIRKTGVFVNASAEEIGGAVRTYFLQAVQLHGEETPELCRSLRQSYGGLEIIKAFGVDDQFDFSATAPYAGHCSFFLFDTKAPEYGGSGRSFAWEVLEAYRGQTRFFLSGGINRQNAAQAAALVRSHQFGAGIDLNSGVESGPGVKSLSLLRAVLDEVRL